MDITVIVGVLVLLIVLAIVFFLVFQKQKRHRQWLEARIDYLEDRMDQLEYMERHIGEKAYVVEEEVDVTKEEYVSINVFYGTDRKETGNIEPKDFFGNQRDELVFGECEVSIPRDHRIGELESPSWRKFQFEEDPTKHIVLLKVSPRSAEEFFSDLRSHIDNSKGKKQAFVFIHGYNVTFEDAARRTAQMAYDLGFDGAPIFFSWPSQGEAAAYTVDEANEEWAVPHLKVFLTEVSTRAGADTIYLIAHSMGTHALSAALRQIANTGPRTQLFKEVVLAAPDIDAEVFKRDILPEIRPTAGRITLYASSKDKALQASKKVHGNPRAGQSELDNMVIAPGLDTIDATEVDTSFWGHSYYAENRSVISDIYWLIVTGNPPWQRQLLEKNHNGQKYWTFRP
jgi:esterase/lipase superfamily enzyme